ncbi:MAG TPA: sialidase family protein [Thermoplasmata archaeon]|nr:sialidase family protein [Thermoplasmata archaeon]
MPPRGWAARSTPETRWGGSALWVGSCLLLLLLSGLTVGSGHLPGPAAPRSGHGPVSRLAREPGAAPLGGLTGTFFVNTTSVQTVPAANRPCLKFGTQRYCFDGQTSPSLLRLRNGGIAAVFQLFTNETNLTCAGASSQTVSRIGISFSTDGGITFGSARLVAGSSGRVCPYFQQIEPAFTTDGPGHLVGAYIGANATASYLLPGGSPYAGAIDNYGVRRSDALIFVRSTNDGATFSAGTILVAGGNLARPAVVASGTTIYLAYEDIANGTTPLPGSTTVGHNASYPVAIHLLVSTDDGSSWHGPYLMPGENSSESNSTFSPSLAVNATGALAVAYATDRSCIAYCAVVSDSVYGEDIVTSVSTTNGTGWSPLRTVARQVAEPGYDGYSTALGVPFYYVWELVPTTSVQFGPLPGELYAAWNGAVNLSTRNYCYYSAYLCDYDDSEVFAAASVDDGAHWAVGPASPGAKFATEQDPGATDLMAYYAPTLGVHGGTVYLAFSERNDTYYLWNKCGYNFPLTGRSAAGSYSSWLVQSPDGVAWGFPRLLSIEYGSGGTAYYEYLGTGGAVSFDASGAPVVAETVPLGDVSSAGTYLVETNLSIARPETGGPTVNLTVAESGVPDGARWSVVVDGNLFSTTGRNLTIVGVPRGVSEFVQPAASDPTLGFQILRVAEVMPGIVSYRSPQNLYAFTAVTLAGLDLRIEPPDVPYFDFLLDDSNTTSGDILANYYLETITMALSGRITYLHEGCPGVWYVPLGASFTVNSGASGSGVLSTFSDDVNSLWTGSGNGSYTGYGPKFPLTMGSALNETFTMLSTSANSSVTFSATDLPSGSNFSLTLNGTRYTAAPGENLSIGGLGWGTFWLTDVTAPGNQTGWGYFGASSVGNPVVVPYNPVVNLSFAYVDLARPAGTVHLHALNLTPGTVWQLAFNGTVYSSATAWINLTTRPGDYPLTAYPVVSSAGGNASYAPGELPAELTVRPGGTYPVSYTPAYGVEFLGSIGGSLSTSGTSWEAPGAQLRVTAHPADGFAWGGWTGTGPGSYSGNELTANVTADGPIVESASFVPLPANRYDLVVNESGVPNGTLWTVYLDGIGYSSTGSQLVVPELYSCRSDPVDGTYAVTVPYAYSSATGNLTRYVPGRYPDAACGGGSLTLSFATEFHLELTSSTGGTVSASSGTQFGTGSGWFTANSSVELAAYPDNGYRFLGWNGTGLGSYTGTARGPGVVMGAPIAEVASFEREVLPGPELVWAVFAPRTPFPAGTSWTLTIGTTNYSSTGAPINVTGLVAGQAYRVGLSDALSPDGLVRYVPVTPQFPLRPLKNGSDPLDFVGSAWVRVAVIGPGLATPAPGWYGLGSAVVLNATPGPSAVFLGWVGSGPGNYTGNDSAPTVHPSGAIEEIAEFRALSPRVVPVTSPWTDPRVVIGLGSAGLAAGIGAGVVLARGRFGRGGTAGARESPPEAEWDRATGEPEAEGGPP